MKDLYIIGAGGFGKEVACLVERINKIKPTWNLKGFIDDDIERHGHIEGGYVVIGDCDYLNNLTKETWAVCAIGSAKIRKLVIDKFSNNRYLHFATLIDPSAMLLNCKSIGKGSVVWAGSILSVDSFIGDHVIVNLACTIGHDVQLNDFVTVYPGTNISGNVVVGECSELGTGMQIIQGKTIAPQSIIGAGAVVVKNIEEAGTYVGSPAKKIK
ncbi:MAG: acetyltransferase, partial [Eubacteriales bacterium]|nr:acetyltransferase [Eubacteriales bacterium]